MARSTTSLLLRRFLRHPIPSPLLLLSHHRPLGFSSLPESQFRSLAWSQAVLQALENLQFPTTLRHDSESEKEKPKMSANENIRKILDSRIGCAQRKCGDRPDIDLPNDFPFEVMFNPADQSITLKREFAGEKIQVDVFMEADTDEDDGDGGSAIPEITLIALIDKGKGPSLEFSCELDADGLHIESMLLKRDDGSYDEKHACESPEFSDLDENLQKSFYKYLEERGISPSLHEFLHKYMVQNHGRGHLNWLKDVKSFIEK